MGPFLFELLPSSEIYLYGYGAFDGADNEERSLDTKAGHITLGEWTHIVVTFTRESLKIYQNGLLVSSKLGCFRNDRHYRSKRISRHIRLMEPHADVCNGWRNSADVSGMAYR